MGFEGLASLLGRQVDCIVGPCDSIRWRRECSVFELGSYDCMLGVPEGHRLSGRSVITWEDLSGDRLMLVRRGLSPAIDAIRDEVEANHVDVRIIDAPGFYSMRMFNDCASEGFLMETLSAWRGVHPSVKTIPMAWDYDMPYGIVYAKEPSEAMRGFVDGLAHAMA